MTHLREHPSCPLGKTSLAAVLALAASCPAILCPAAKATPAGSGGPVRIAHQDGPGRSTLTVNSIPVATLLGIGGLSGSERAEKAVARLSGWTSAAPRFSVGKVGNEWAVVVNGGAVITPGHDDAVRAGVPRRALAHQWAARLASAWATPYLKVNPTGVVVPVGGSRWLKVSGAARGPISVDVDNAPHLSAQVVRGNVVQLTGLRPGRGSVTVTRDGVSATAAFLVMKPAGAVKPVTVEVTGSAIPGDLLEDVVDAEARRVTELEPGAWFTTKSRPTFPTVWTRGDRLHYSIPIRLAGPGYLPVQTTLDIRVRRRHLPRPANITLFYSNKPETIRKPQILFWHSLTEKSPARLLYHHQNMGSQPLNLAVDLVNEGSTEAPVQIVDGTVAPAMDTVLVGHMAAFKFLKRTQDGTGIIVHIPPKGRRRVFLRRLDRGDTLSGIMLVRPLDDARLTLSMCAEDVDRNDAPQPSNNETETVFPDPDKAMDVSYSVGGPWSYIPIGRYPVQNDHGLTLDGNYGVLYTVRLKLDNPTAQSSTVRVLFEPRAGEARGAFIIDGTLTETPSTYPPAEVRVMTVPLAPHQTKTVTLVTMPAAGGSYPAALIVHG